MHYQGFNKPDSYFYDNKHFPYGFGRSGQFTLQQAELLNLLGRQLQALQLGSCLPETAEEKQFVAVMAGHAAPSSLVERVWYKYQQITTSLN
jgi:uncharacterized protein YifE (UPF0438 family)